MANSGVLPPAALAALRTLLAIDTEALNEASEELADRIENGTVPSSWHTLQYQLEALVEQLEDLASLCEEAAPEALQQPAEAISAA
jgi:flagellar biosynthesis chaperone FliJ